MKVVARRFPELLAWNCTLKFEEKYGNKNITEPYVKTFFVKCFTIITRKKFVAE